MTSARVRSRMPGAMVQPRSASRGRTSPMARVMVERSTPNQQASTSWVAPWRRWTRVASSRSTNTSRCFAPAPTARFRGRETSLAWCRSCHNGPTSATSSAITSGDSPVILRSLMIAARDRVPHHTTMINDQASTPPPTMHELARVVPQRISGTCGTWSVRWGRRAFFIRRRRDCAGGRCQPCVVDAVAFETAVAVVSLDPS